MGFGTTILFTGLILGVRGTFDPIDPIEAGYKGRFFKSFMTDEEYEKENAALGNYVIHISFCQVM